VISVVKRLSIIDVERCTGCQLCMFACSRRSGVGGMGQSRILVRSAGGIERGFVVVVCRACLTPPCLKVCPVDAISQRPGGGVIVDPSTCIGCHRCEEACPFGAVMWDQAMNKPMICFHCGYCSQFCPFKVIALEEVTTRS